MDLKFDPSLAAYKSASQNVRAMSEGWASTNLYCPNCGKSALRKFANNRPVADFYCESCAEQFELKAGRSAAGRRIVNGAYQTLLDRLTSNTVPNLLLLHYSANCAAVHTLIAIPRRFFVPSIVERRKPLAETARRAGWVGSNIRLDLVPTIGRIRIVADGIPVDKQAVQSTWHKSSHLDGADLESRGWLLDVLLCVDKIASQSFSLQDVYAFEAHLQKLHPQNGNVRPKIRQQLQVLRDRNYIEFISSGQYRKKG